MSSGTRTTVQILMLCGGFLLGGVYALTALATAWDFGDSAEDARRGIELSVAGNLLTAAGWVGNSVCVAVGFQDWGSMRRPFPRLLQVPGGRRGRWRVNRQIDGKEPHREDEVALLRWVAEERVVKRRGTTVNWMTWPCLIAVFAGGVLRPAELRLDPPLSLFISATVLRGLSGVAMLLLVAFVVVGWRMRDDVKGKAFLERTRPAAWLTNPGRWR